MGTLHGHELTLVGILNKGMMLNDAESAEDEVVQATDEEEKEQEWDAPEQLHHLQGVGKLSQPAVPSSDPPDYPQPLTMCCSSGRCTAGLHGKMKDEVSSRSRGSSVCLFWVRGRGCLSADSGTPYQG